MFWRTVRRLRSLIRGITFRWRFRPIRFDMGLRAGGVTHVCVREATSLDVHEWARTWKPQLTDRPERDWDWQLEVRRAATDPDFLCLAVVDDDGLQGLVSLRVARGESLRRAGDSLVYVEYLGVAPWNQLPERRIQGIGTVLLQRAADLASDIGFGGRIGLDSKEQSVGFYRKISWLDEVGPHTLRDGTWVYFEGEFTDDEAG
jgi:GNAT superfamily N-acetyltransferase